MASGSERHCSNQRDDGIINIRLLASGSERHLRGGSGILLSEGLYKRLFIEELSKLGAEYMAGRTRSKSYVRLEVASPQCCGVPLTPVLRPRTCGGR